MKSLPSVVIVLVLGAAAGLGWRIVRHDPGSVPPRQERTPAKTSTPQGGANEVKAEPTRIERLAAIPGVVDLKNARCPVMDNEVPAGDPTFLLYNGVIVRFCCPGCDSKFLEDPLKYFRKLADGDTQVPAALLTAEGNPPVVAAKNTRCPVMDNEIGAEAKLRAVYDGVAVSMCCPPCLDRFARDPKAMLAKAAESGSVPAERLK